MRILLQSPCNDLQESLQQYLELFGHQVKVIDNLTSTLSMYTIFDAELLISEYDSDNPDYVKLFKRIHATNSFTKIIVLTCNALSVDEVAELTNIGVYCVFKKPIDPEIIKNTIDVFEADHKSVSSLTKQTLIPNLFTNNRV